MMTITMQRTALESCDSIAGASQQFLTLVVMQLTGQPRCFSS